MSTTSIRCAATGLLSTCAFVAVFAVGVVPASAAPEEGGRVVAPAACSHVAWGWPGGAYVQAYPGQRFGAFLAPECRGPVLEGLDR